MKILYLSMRNLLLPGNPRVKHIRALAAHLSRRHVVSLGVISEVRDPRTQAALGEALPKVSSIRFFPPPPFNTLLAQLATGLMRGQPLQLQLSYSGAIERAVLDYFQSRAPDVVIYDTVRLFKIFQAVQRRGGARHILDMDDLFSHRYESMLATPHRASLLGNFQRRLPQWATKLANAFEGPLLRYEKATLKGIETAAPTLFDEVVLVSSVEAESLRRRTGRDNIHCIPQVIPQLRFVEKGPVPGESSKPHAFFTGDFRFAPNVASLEWMVDRIVPRIVARVPDFRLHLFGPRMPDAWARRLRDTPYASYHGFVDDLHEAIKNYAVCLAPIPFGSGVKTKILEAMSWRKVVISNTTGFEGLPVTPGLNCILANDSDDIAERTIAILGDTEAQDRIGAAAQTLARETFAPDDLLRAWAALLEYR